MTATAAPVRVVIVDDHPVMRKGFRSVLAKSEVQVVGEASTGTEAVALARELRPDVILMDIRMPDMDGLAATRIIKAEQPEVAVLMMTGYETTSYLREALAAGASGYVLKALDPHLLSSTIMLLRNGESPVDSQLLGRLLQELKPEPAGATPLCGGEIGGLSAFEQTVLHMIIEGRTNGEIAAELHYAVGTVKNAVQRIIEKLGASDRTHAAVLAVRAGMGRQ